MWHAWRIQKQIEEGRTCFQSVLPFPKSIQGCGFHSQNKTAGDFGPWRSIPDPEKEQRDNKGHSKF
jgi:hypothetical protein